MTIIDKPLGELTPYENNPRYNDAAVDAVAESIRQFGFKVPIVIDKDGVIIAGHTRLKAALKLGLATAPCVVADDLTPEQAKAFRLADNKTGELADWDLDKLTAELDGIADIDMTGFGFALDTASLADGDTTQHTQGRGAAEVDLGEVADGKFAHECPRCGFKFNEGT